LNRKDAKGAKKNRETKKGWVEPKTQKAQRKTGKQTKVGLNRRRKWRKEKQGKQKENLAFFASLR